MPDLTVVFDVDEQTAAKRAGISAKGLTSLFADRMEDRDRDFRRRVRQSYLDQAAADPGRYAVIDARDDEERVWSRLLAALRERAPKLR
jgi:dTMP kinase